MTTYKGTGSMMPDSDPGSFSLDSPVVASFLSSFPADLQSSTPTLIDASSPTASLTAPLGVVLPGASVAIEAVSRAGVLIGGSAEVDLSSSYRPNGAPVPISVAAAGGSNNVLLNYGPTYAVSIDGNDTIVSSGGRDLLRSAVGQDSLVGGGQSHLVGGIAGDDTLVGGVNDGARDTIVSQGASHIWTSVGNNVIHGGANDTINAGAASDTISVADGAATIRGGSDALVYGSGHSSIRAGGGDNNTFSLTGDDTIMAGRGSAVVDLNDRGHASVHGGAGHLDVNVASNRVGDDTLFGGSGGLTIHMAVGAGAILNDPNTLDANGYHVVQLAGGETLHVSNVTIDFADGQHRAV